MLRVKQVKYESRYSDKTKRPKPKEKKIRILPENSAEDHGFSRERCWGYVSINENTTEKL